MLTLAWRNLGLRPTRTLFTVIAIALGVAMILATRIVGAATDVAAATARQSTVAGADLAVTSAFQAHFDETVVATLRAEPGIDVAIPLYRRLEGQPDASRALNPLGPDYRLKGTGLTLLGVDPAAALTRYPLAGGRFFADPAAREVIVPDRWAAAQGLGLDSTVDLATGWRTQSYRIVGLLDTQARGLTGGAGTRALVPLATLQTAFGTPAAVNQVLIRLGPGIVPATARQTLQTRLGNAFVVTSAEGESGSGRQLITALIDVALPMATLVLIAGGAFLIYNAFTSATRWLQKRQNRVAAA